MCFTGASGDSVVSVQSAGNAPGARRRSSRQVSVACAGRTTSNCGSPRASSSTGSRHQVRALPSGLVSRATNRPRSTPCITVSSTIRGWSILGSRGRRVNAPVKSRTNLASSSSRHKSKGPPGRSASASTAVSMMRARSVSALIAAKSGPAPPLSLKARTSLASSTVTTIEYACRMMSGACRSASARRRRKRSFWTGSTVCTSSCCCTSSHPSSARTAWRAPSRPSRDRTAATTALRCTRGRSEPVVSSKKRFASRLGFPESDAAAAPRTT